MRGSVPFSIKYPMIPWNLESICTVFQSVYESNCRPVAHVEGFHDAQGGAPHGVQVGVNCQALGPTYGPRPKQEGPEDDEHDHARLPLGGKAIQGTSVTVM